MSLSVYRWVDVCGCRYILTSTLDLTRACLLACVRRAGIKTPNETCELHSSLRHILSGKTRRGRICAMPCGNASACDSKPCLRRLLTRTPNKVSTIEMAGAPQWCKGPTRIGKSRMMFPSMERRLSLVLLATFKLDPLRGLCVISVTSVRTNAHAFEHAGGPGIRAHGCQGRRTLRRPRS
jgi:hypothetical protein